MATGPFNRLVGANAAGELPDQVAGILKGTPGDSALPAPYTANISGAYTIDATKPVQVLTVTGAVTISMPAVPAGKTTPISVTLVQDATGYAVTLPTGSSTPACRWGDGIAPTIPTTPASQHDLYFRGDEVLGWRGYTSGRSMA